MASKVDIAKAARNRLTAWMYPSQVVFHHVPKCGGTSVGRALRKRYILSQETVLPEETFRALESFTGRTDRQQMLVDVLDLREQMFLYLLHRNVRCISAHVRFSENAYRDFANKYAFITILREPVERFLSHYYWSHGKPDAHGRIEEEFEAFLDSPRAQKLGATYSEYFCGLPKETNFRSETAIAAAKTNLSKLAVIGMLDDLPSFEKDIKQKLGLRIKVGYENRGRKDNYSFLRATPAWQRVQDLCEPDREIYEHAVKEVC